MRKKAAKEWDEALMDIQRSEADDNTKNEVLNEKRVEEIGLADRKIPLDMLESIVEAALEVGIIRTQYAQRIPKKDEDMTKFDPLAEVPADVWLSWFVEHMVEMNESTESQQPQKAAKPQKIKGKK